MGACCTCKKSVIAQKTTELVVVPSPFAIEKQTPVKRESVPDNSRSSKQRSAAIGRLSVDKSPSPPRGVFHSKRPSSPEKLLQCLQGHFLLKHLEEENLSHLISCMSLYEVAPREVIIEQGEHGYFFYILSKGRVEVRVNGIRSKVLGPGCCFGELALVDDTVRSASIVSIDRSFVWALDRHSFKNALQAISEQNYEENKKFLDNIKLFDGLNDSQKYHMLYFMTSQTWEEGQHIVREGDSGSLLYIIIEGSVVCTQKGKQLRVLGKGEIFGEQALLNGSVRTATVTAIEPVKLLSVSQENLVLCFGEHLEEVIYKNAIRIILENNQDLKILTASQIEHIINSMRYFSFQHSEMIIKSSEVKGQKLYVILKGSVLPLQSNCIGSADLFTNNSEIFGSAVRAEGPVTLALIERKDIEDFVGEELSSIFDHNQIITVLQSMSVLKTLPSKSMRQLANIATKRVYSRGETIFSEDSPSDSLFIIQIGTVTLWKEGILVRNFSDLSYFGEKALISSENRKARAVASTYTCCWEISISAFAQAINPGVYKQIVQRIELQDDDIKLEDLIPIRYLGKGTSGNVFLCGEKEKRNMYALKTIHRHTVNVYDLRENLKNERNILLELDHPLIMKLVKTFKDNNRAYFLTEFVNGKDLFDVLRVLGCLKEKDAKFYSACLLLILELLKDRKIVYRDLKPENIMVDHEGYLKLVDMGTAKITKERSYTAIGTPHYMAPETIMGTGSGLEVDWWGLGVLVYEFLYGDVPFGGSYDDIPSVYEAVLTQNLEFPPNTKMNKAKQFIESLLNRKPHLRASGDIKKMKVHQWLRTFDWDSLYCRTAPAPHLPKTKNHSKRLDNAIQQNLGLLDYIEKKEQISKVFYEDWDFDF